MISKSAIWLAIGIDFFSFLGGKYNISFLEREKSSFANVAEMPSGHRGSNFNHIVKGSRNRKDSTFKDQKPPVLLRENAGNPKLSAKASILYIPETGQVLYGENFSERRSVASLVKIVTALYVQRNFPEDHIFQIPENIFLDPLESRAGFLPGERVSREVALKSLMIPSANEVAWAVTGGFRDSSSEKSITDINEMLREFGIRDTAIKNPVGLDQEGQFSTAFDIAVLTSKLLEDEKMRSIVVTREEFVTSIDGNRYLIRNTNQLLSYPYLEIAGVKTGTTSDAGPSLVSFFGRDGYTYIGVILSSEERFQDMKALLSWADAWSISS